MGKTIIGIIGVIVGGIVDRLLNWLFNKVKEKNPLDIKIDTRHLIRTSHSVVISRECPLEFLLPLNLTNKTSQRFVCSFYNFSFQPKESNRELVFKIYNGIYTKMNAIILEDFYIEPNSSRKVYFHIQIKSRKEQHKEEFQEYLKNIENKSIILKFHYNISTDGKDREYCKEIKDFFKNVAKLTEDFK